MITIAIGMLSLLIIVDLYIHTPYTAHLPQFKGHSMHFTKIVYVHGNLSPLSHKNTHDNKFSMKTKI